MIRGLLCSQCNSGIGYLKDSVENLTRAIQYLQRSRNIRLITMPWGFEIHRRVVDNDPKSSFKQFGAGVGVTIEN